MKKAEYTCKVCVTCLHLHSCEKKVRLVVIYNNKSLEAMKTGSISRVVKN